MSDERETMDKIAEQFRRDLYAAEDKLRMYQNKLNDIQRDKMYLTEDYYAGRITREQYQIAVDEHTRTLTRLTQEYATKDEQKGGG